MSRTAIILLDHKEVHSLLSGPKNELEFSKGSYLGKNGPASEGWDPGLGHPTALRDEADKRGSEAMDPQASRSLGWRSAGTHAHSLSVSLTRRRNR